MGNRRRWLVSMIILVFILVFTFFASLFVGTVKISPFGFIGDEAWTILYGIRLPRIILGITAGAGLAVAGTIFQALLRNPLSDPYILGTSSGAALGVVLCISCGINIPGVGLPIAAFLFALLSIVMVYNIARTCGKIASQTLLLSGVIASTFFSALMMLIMSLRSKEIYEITFWIMGNLAQTDFNLIKVVSVYTFIGITVSYFFARDLNVLSFGEETAHQLGIEVEKTKKILFFLASLIVGGVVSVSGMIGFVGLIMPHIIRKITGPDHRILIPASALSGAIFLLIADAIARTVASPLEIPVGVITALFGGPFFVYLLKKK